jgi:hypothetical protein
MRPDNPYEAEWYPTQKIPRIPPGPKNRELNWLQLLMAVASVAAIIGLLVTLGIIHPFGGSSGPSSTSATATVNPLASYAAATPGYGCDHSGGIWSNDQIPNTAWLCSSKGLILTQNPSAAATEAEVTFHWPGHTFATNFLVHVTMNNIHPAIACGGVGFRAVDLKDQDQGLTIDSSYSKTHGLNFDCDPYTSTFSQPNTATFSDFVYTPLP